MRKFLPAITLISTLAFSSLPAEEIQVDFKYMPYDSFTVFYEIQIPKHLQEKFRPYKSMIIEALLSEKIMKKFGRKPIITATLSDIYDRTLLKAVETKKNLKIVANYMKKKPGHATKIENWRINKRSTAERSLIYKVLRRAITDYHASCAKYNNLSQALSKRYHPESKHNSPLVSITRPIVRPSETAQIKQLTEFSVSRKYEVTTMFAPSQEPTKEYFTIELFTYKKPPLMANLAVIRTVKLPAAIQNSLHLPDFKPRFEVEVLFPNRNKIEESIGTGIQKDSIWIFPHATGVSILKKSETVPAAILSKLKPLILEEIKNYQQWQQEYLDRLYQDPRWKTESLKYIDE